MKFDYSAYEYLPECSDGCQAITDWLPSFEAAREAGNNHGKQTGHKWLVQERLKEGQKAKPETEG